MRPFRLAVVALLGLVPVARTVLADSEAVRTLRAELSGKDAANFCVENLAGTMRITAGTGDTVSVVATVYAESAALADAVRLERLAGDGGAATLRVRYPYDRVSTFRYREPSDRSGDFFLGWESGSSTYSYDGRRVRVSRGHGVRLHADLEVRVPRGRNRADFLDLAGLVEAEGIEGQLQFRVASADLRLRRLEGDISVDGSSGDIRARDIKGSWKSDFSSGDCRIDGFEGDAFTLKTSSGDLILRSVRARRVELETSSGDLRLVDADVEEFAAEATSGDVSLESVGTRLKDARIRTSSGDVSLRLPSTAVFELDADQSSGDIEVGFSDGIAVRRRDEIVGYRRGSGGARIRVKTSSGDLSVLPS